jgi:hypothetical protein
MGDRKEGPVTTLWRRASRIAIAGLKASAGAAAAYFLHPIHGEARRAEALRKLRTGVRSVFERGGKTVPAFLVKGDKDLPPGIHQPSADTGRAGPTVRH